MTTDAIRDAEYRLQLTRSVSNYADELAGLISHLGETFPDPEASGVHALLEAVLTAAADPLEAAIFRAQTDLGYLTGAIPRPEPETVTRHRDAGSGRYVTEAEADARPETTVSETREVGR